MEYRHKNKIIIRIFLFYLMFIIIKSNNLSSGKIEKQAKTNNSIEMRGQKSFKKKIKKSSKRQLLDDEYFRKLKIYLDLFNFHETFPTDTINTNYKEVFINSMNKAKDVLESFIKIYYNSEYYEFEINKLEDYGLEKWNTDYYGVPVEEKNDARLRFMAEGFTNVIFFKFDSLGEENMASSKILITDFYETPYFGIITLNKNFPLSKLQPNYLEALMLHQFTHLLGFHIEIEVNACEGTEFFTGIIQDNSEDEPPKVNYFLDFEHSPNVITYAQNYFGCSTLTSIDLEIDDYNNVHWPSRFFLGEYMTKFNYPEEQVISGFTLSFLKDLPHIKIEKFYTGGLMRFGKNQGCNFLTKKCIDDDAKFENDFYYPLISTDFNFDSTESSCSSGRLSRTVHKLNRYNSVPEGNEFNYETGDHILYSGFASANYCPVSEYETINENNIYIYSCSKKGIISNDARNIFGEAISDNSFCVLNTLVKNSISNPSLYNQVRAGCYNMFCTSRSLTIQVGEDFIVCPRGGGHKKLKNYNGYILCPDYNLICTINNDEEEELCNDMFDCVTKKIEEKGTYSYDYVSQTTQDSSVYPGLEITTDIGEETDKGKCPKNCIQCKENTGCFQCGANYGLVGTNENNLNEKILCKEQDFLTSNPYYQKDNLIFYPCSDNCLSCQDKNTCLECSTNYKIENGKCKEKVENCLQYDGDKCTECKNDYFLVKEGEEITYCVADANVGNYYYSETSGGSTYYIKCSFKIPHCNKCLAEDNCIECINNNNDERFAIIGDNHEECKDLSTNKYYLDSLDNKYKECSNQLDYCQTCKLNEFNILNCLSCSSGDYTLVHSDIDKCISSTEIGNDFFKDDELNYFSCSSPQYHSVEHCLKCRDKESCLSCQNGYALLNSNKLCASNDKLINKNYFKINNNFYLCSEKIKGCERCTDEETCLECNTSFDLDENNKCIPSALSATRYYKDPTTSKYISCEKIENCEECSSATECTKCKNGYQLDNSICKEININAEKQNEDKDYDKLKGLAIGAIVLGCIATVVSILAIIFVFFKKLICKKSKKIDGTESVNINNEEANEIVVQSSKRSIRNKNEEQI